MATISQAVGIRNGQQMMPNQPQDLRAITGLLDRIPLSSGGTAATPGMWSTDRTLLITQVTAAIVAFQTANRRRVIDGVVDPGGGTLNLMNQLATQGPPVATIASGDVSSQLWVVAEPNSVDSGGTLVPRDISPSLTRKLVSVDNSSVKWFGVVIPLNQIGGVAGGLPHIFFTPSPNQGGYHDGAYDQFTRWNGLWDKYTSAIGSQLVVSGAPQILVIPFYKNSQVGNLGSFLSNWREVISEVVSVCINSIDPLFLRDRYEFNGIYTSSFSNGIATHQNFNTQGTGVSSMTRVGFDLDGQASGSHWHPSGGVVYKNTRAAQSNSTPTHFHVGGRFGQMRPRYPGTSDHNMCPFLLLHGLTRFGR